MKKLGRQTIRFENKPGIISFAAVGGKNEGEGPLKNRFDYLNSDTYFGADSWEGAESAMLRKCFDISLEKGKLKPCDIDCIFGGDLLNQCVASGFGLYDLEIPFYGIYGACSTMAESIILASKEIDGGYADKVCAITSSHFCSAERQFRQPLAYGGQRTPTSQWTATASGSLIIGKNSIPKITEATTGILVDSGISDASNMGAAMAPAALETLCTHFKESNRNPDYYDFIATGDLGYVGSELLREMALEKGYDIRGIHQDCGNLLYDKKYQDVNSGASGCGCSASVLCCELLPRMCRGEIKKLLFAATGAIMSPTTSLQGKNILGICHAVSIELR